MAEQERSDERWKTGAGEQVEPEETIANPRERKVWSWEKNLFRVMGLAGVILFLVLGPRFFNLGTPGATAQGLWGANFGVIRSWLPEEPQEPSFTSDGGHEEGWATVDAAFYDPEPRARIWQIAMEVNWNRVLGPREETAAQSYQRTVEVFGWLRSVQEEELKRSLALWCREVAADGQAPEWDRVLAAYADGAYERAAEIAGNAAGAARGQRAYELRMMEGHARFQLNQFDSARSAYSAAEAAYASQF